MPHGPEPSGAPPPHPEAEFQGSKTTSETATVTVSLDPPTVEVEEVGGASGVSAHVTRATSSHNFTSTENAPLRSSTTATAAATNGADLLLSLAAATTAVASVDDKRAATALIMDLQQQEHRRSSLSSQSLPPNCHGNNPITPSPGAESAVSLHPENPVGSPDSSWAVQQQVQDGASCSLEAAMTMSVHSNGNHRLYPSPIKVSHYAAPPSSSGPVSSCKTAHNGSVGFTPLSVGGNPGSQSAQLPPWSPSPCYPHQTMSPYNVFPHNSKPPEVTAQSNGCNGTESLRKPDDGAVSHAEVLRSRQAATNSCLRSDAQNNEVSFKLSRLDSGPQPVSLHSQQMHPQLLSSMSIPHHNNSFQQQPIISPSSSNERTDDEETTGEQRSTDNHNDTGGHQNNVCTNQQQQLHGFAQYATPPYMLAPYCQHPPHGAYMHPTPYVSASHSQPSFAYSHGNYQPAMHVPSHYFGGVPGYPPPPGMHHPHHPVCAMQGQQVPPPSTGQLGEHRKLSPPPPLGSSDMVLNEVPSSSAGVVKKRNSGNVAPEGRETVDSHRSDESWKQQHEKDCVEAGMAPNYNRCVPLKHPISSRYWGSDATSKAHDIKLPDFGRLVNFPDYLARGRGGSEPKGSSGQHHLGGNSSNCLSGKRHCVMCGTLRVCSANSMVGRRVTTAESLASGDSATHIIPRQNKGVCTACDVAVWVLVERDGLEIKWCKGCKNFRPWAAFGDKGMATKCVRCRTRQKEKYALQKTGAMMALRRSQGYGIINSNSVVYLDEDKDDDELAAKGLRTLMKAD